MYFEVHPSLCVASVNFTLSSSTNGADTSAYLMDVASAGPGTSLSNASTVAVATTSTTNASVGWTEPRSFTQRLTALPVEQDSTVYLVVIVTGCTGVRVTTTSPVPLIVDQSPPEFDYTSGRGDLTTKPQPKLLYASWPQLRDAESGVALVYGQFFVEDAVGSAFVDVTGVQELAVAPRETLADGTNVTFSLSARNGAGVVVVQNTTGLVDASPSICGTVEVGWLVCARAVCAACSVEHRRCLLYCFITESACSCH